MNKWNIEGSSNNSLFAKKPFSHSSCKSYVLTIQDFFFFFLKNMAEHNPWEVTLCFLPELPMGDVAGVPLWTFSPNDWEAAGGTGWSAAPEGPGRDPGGVSLCGDVSGVLRGVLGCEVCPPASRASRLLRILKKKKQHSSFAHLYWGLTNNCLQNQEFKKYFFIGCIFLIHISRSSKKKWQKQKINKRKPWREYVCYRIHNIYF